MLTNIILRTTDPVICNASGVELRPGDQVRLHLDTENVPGLPEFIVGTVQTPVVPARVIDEETGCPIMGREYLVSYETDDLEGVLNALRDDDVIQVECVTCCMVLNERIDAEVEAREAADTAEALARAAADTAEANARIAADAALNVEMLKRLIFDSAITGLTGGGASKLDGVPTVGVTAGQVRLVKNGSGYALYRLIAADLPEGSPGNIRPNDYATGTNEKVWVMQSLQASTLSSALNLLELVGAFTARIYGVGLTADRDYQLPNASGVVMVGNAYANLGLANAGEGEIGVVYFDTTAGKPKVTTDVV